MTRYNLPDEGSQAWYADPLNPAVADLDRRLSLTEQGAGDHSADLAVALDAAYAAQATADAAIRTYYLANPPWSNGSSQPDSSNGDLWFDTNTNQTYRWDGTTWTLIQDNSINAALAAAQNAQTTADGKITAYRQPTQPWLDGDPLHVDDVGDLWFDNTGAPGRLAVPNSGFETDTTGWDAGGTTLTRDTAQAHSGTASGKVVAFGNGPAIITPTPLYSVYIAVLPSTTYTVSVWLKGNVGGEFLRLELYDNSVDTVDQDATLTTQWQQFSITYTTKAWSTGFQFRIFTLGQVWSTWFVDDFVIEGPPAPSDNQATPYYWTGTQWAPISDSAIAAAQAAADAAQSTADTALAAVSYHHVQGTVSATWSIQHNLGYYPNVSVKDSAGDSWEGDVTYDSTDHLTIRFSAAFSGVADLS